MTDRRDLPCSNCGAALRYDPGALTLSCSHCGTLNNLPPEPKGPWGKAGEIRELDYRAALADRLAEAEIEESATIPCPGCGAEIGFDADTVADECPFCATPLSKADSHPHRHPKPQAVLPFALPEREARERMAAWLGGLWFAPSGLKRYAESGRPMSGVYLPYYTYDADADADYNGMRGDAYFVTQMVSVTQNGKSKMVPRKVRKIRWTPVSGHVRRLFDDVLVPASETLSPSGGQAEDGGRSWDLIDLKPYSTDFLAGFRAEAPNLPLERGFEQARAVMEDGLRYDIRADIGGDEQRIARMSARYNDITFKHILLPVWLAAYRFKNRPFRVVINGRTGVVSGERPWSAVKIAIAVAVGLAVAAGIVWLLIEGN